MEKRSKTVLNAGWMRISLIRIIVLCAVLACGILVRPDVRKASAEDTDIRILFIGNSHTYTNDVPALTKMMFASAGKTIEVDDVTVAGVSLLWHSTNSNTLQAINSGIYDYVVLQEKAQNFSLEDMRSGAKILCDAIKAVGAQSIFYMTWSIQSEPQMQQTITDANVQVAAENGGWVAPAGVVWDIIRNENEDIRLYVDGVHATPIGSYIAVSALYYIISGTMEPLYFDKADFLIQRIGSINLNNCNMIHKLACEYSLLYGPERELFGLEIDAPAKTKTIAYGGNLDLSSLKVIALYDRDGSLTLKPDEYTADTGDFDAKKAGKYTVTISYEGFEQVFEVTVAEAKGCGNAVAGAVMIPFMLGSAIIFKRRAFQMR